MHVEVLPKPWVWGIIIAPILKDQGLQLPFYSLCEALSSSSGVLNLNILLIHLACFFLFPFLFSIIDIWQGWDDGDHDISQEIILVQSELCLRFSVLQSYLFQSMYVWLQDTNWSDREDLEGKDGLKHSWGANTCSLLHFTGRTFHLFWWMHNISYLMLSYLLLSKIVIYRFSCLLPMNVNILVSLQSTIWASQQPICHHTLDNLGIRLDNLMQRFFQRKYFPLYWTRPIWSSFWEVRSAYCIFVIDLFGHENTIEVLWVRTLKTPKSVFQTLSFWKLKQWVNFTKASLNKRYFGQKLFMGD